MKSKPETSLPQAPSIPLKFRLYPFQMVLLPFLFVIPILALTGLFGGKMEEKSRTEEAITLEVTFPPTTRFDQPEMMQIGVYNGSDQPLTAASLTIDRAYLDNFTAINFNPAEVLINQESYIFTLDVIPSGEAYFVNLDYRAMDTGTLAGTVSLRQADAPDIVIEISTFVFP